jgi:hypothetical protein
MATKISCKATDCIFNENRVCTSEEIVYDPEEGCLTYEVLEDLVDVEEEDWEEDELADEDEDLTWDEDDDLFDEDDLDEDGDDDDKWSL